MIRVQQSIEVHELDGKEAPHKGLVIGVDSHWNRRNFIVLIVNEHRYTVVGADLLAAVENARNINR